MEFYHLANKSKLRKQKILKITKYAFFIWKERKVSAKKNIANFFQAKNFLYMNQLNPWRK